MYVICKGGIICCIRICPASLSPAICRRCASKQCDCFCWRRLSSNPRLTKKRCVSQEVRIASRTYSRSTSPGAYRHSSPSGSSPPSAQDFSSLNPFRPTSPWIALLKLKRWISSIVSLALLLGEFGSPVALTSPVAFPLDAAWSTQALSGAAASADFDEPLQPLVTQSVFRTLGGPRLTNALSAIVQSAQNQNISSMELFEQIRALAKGRSDIKKLDEYLLGKLK